MTDSSREPVAPGDREPRPNLHTTRFTVPVSTTALSRRELRQRESISDVHPAVETRRQRRDRELAAASAASSAASEALAPVSGPARKPAERVVSKSLFAQQLDELAARAAAAKAADAERAGAAAADRTDEPIVVEAAERAAAEPLIVESAVPAAAEPLVVESAEPAEPAAAEPVVMASDEAVAETALAPEPDVESVTVESVTEQLSIVTVVQAPGVAESLAAPKSRRAAEPRGAAEQPAAESLNEAPEFVAAPEHPVSAHVAAPRSASSSVSASTKRRVLPVRRRRAASTRPNDRKRSIISTVVMIATAGLVATVALPAYAYSDLGSLNNSNSSASAQMGIQSLTVSSDAIQDAPRDGYTSTGDIASMDSTTGSTVSPTVQALAAELMADVASGKLVGSVPNHIVEIQNLANGVVVPNCGVDYRVLQAIKVAVDNFDKVGISDINRKCTGQIEGAGTASAHYTDGGGHAVDFYILNGHGLTGGDADSLKLIALLDPLVPPGSGLGQAECRGSISVTNFAPFDDTCTHDHIDFLNAKGVALKSS